MEKRYQVFVSSTYADLQEERRNVIQTLMEMDCIPSGMEIFPAADEEQCEFIKKIISDCDYYILIIGGRYGSVTSEGISFTEKEYDFAVSIGLKVLAFLHKNPEEISAKYTELNPELREKLDSFRRRVSGGRLVKFWKKADELPGLVALSLSKTIKTYPAQGWVRADRISTEDVLNEINELRKRNQELEYLITQFTSQRIYPEIEYLNFHDPIEIKGQYLSDNNKKYRWKYTISLSELTKIMAPYLFDNPTDALIKKIMSEKVFAKTNKRGTPYIDDQIYQKIQMTFIALDIITIDYFPTNDKKGNLSWRLTPNGRNLVIQIQRTF